MDLNELIEKIKNWFFGNGIKGFLSKAFMMYFLINILFKQFNSSSSTSSKVEINNNHQNLQLSPLFPLGQPLDIRVYITENETILDYSKEPNWIIKKFVIGMKNNEKKKLIEIPITKSIQNNGSLYAHVIVTKSNREYNPCKFEFSSRNSYEISSLLTKYKLTKIGEEKKLLFKKVDEVEEIDEITGEIKKEIKSFWFKKFSIKFVNFNQPIHSSKLLPQMIEKMKILSTKNGKIGKFYPICYIDEFWMIKESLIPINESITSLPLELIINDESLFKFQLGISMEIAMSNPHLKGEEDEFKRILTETNPYMLGLFIIVTIFHTVFDFLAFKNDIKFWNSRKSLRGLSTRSLILNFFCEFVIFLYLLDNDTSFMVLVSCFFSILIEGWKIFKTMSFKLKSKFPFIKILDKLDYEESNTKEYDSQAMLYLSYLLFPLVTGYSIYSLIYKKHKSFYSWLISSLVNSVYLFGFLRMVPQLLINYKLKSVAYMNWKTMTYKSISTFIDDLFAIVVKMPTIHRLATLRDDVIFFIYLYQRKIYKIDPTRVNEYGQLNEDLIKSIEEKGDEDNTNNEEIEKKIIQDVNTSIEEKENLRNIIVNTSKQKEIEIQEQLIEEIEIN